VEALLLWPALACYAMAGAAWSGVRLPRSATPESVGGGLLATGLLLHTLSISVRWQELGHGPFTTLYEILTSNVWSLTFVLAVACTWLPALRRSAVVALAVIGVLAIWMLAVDARPGHFPATYHTALLYVHTALGKVFLGLLLVAVGLAGVILLRRTESGRRRFEPMPDDESLAELAHRFAAFAFVFESLMLIAGAVWAQDAWGRYWAWDPLETWAFLTWLALAFTLHLRAARRPSPVVHALMLWAVFVLAFLTFFGVPFISESPHKGAV